MRRIGCWLVGIVLAALAGLPALAEVRILAFGDSLTYGSGVVEEDGFVPQLEAWLRQNGAPDVVVLNAGVPGEVTAEGRARIGPTLADTRPDAVIVALGANDLLRGLSVRRMFANLDGILDEVDAAGLPALLAGLPPVPTWRQEDRARYRDAFRAVAEQHDAIFVRSFLGGMSGQGILAVRRMMQPDGIHPNAEGVRANVAAIGPMVRELADRARAAPGR